MHVEPKDFAEASSVGLFYRVLKLGVLIARRLMEVVKGLGFPAAADRTPKHVPNQHQFFEGILVRRCSSCESWGLERSESSEALNWLFID